MIKQKFNHGKLLKSVNIVLTKEKMIIFGCEIIVI